MASVSSSSSGASTMAALGINNKGIGGLVSGLDTDSLVEALTSGTRAKIAKQGQDRQLLNWKMTAYRSMATALSAFQKKSFSFTSSTSTNIMSNAFFNTYKASSTSDKISVKTTGSSINTNFTIDKVQQLATNETITNKTKLSTELTGGIALTKADGTAYTASDFAGQTLKLNVDNDVQTIKLDNLKNAIKEDGTLDATKLQSELQTLVDKAYGTKNVYVKDEDGEGQEIEVKKEVKNVEVSFGTNGELKLDSDSAQISIAANNDLLGLKEGRSNRVLMSTKIGEIDAFQGVLQGDIMKISINGATIEVSKDDTLATLKSKIDSSAAGVTFSYSKINDEFTLTSKKTGVGENIVMRDVQGNLMNTLFGAQSGNSVGTNWLLTDGAVVTDSTTKLVGSDGKSLGSKLSQMEFTLTINGETKRIKADTSALTTDERNAISSGGFTQDMMIKALNKGITNAFGAASTVRFEAAANGKVELASKENPSVAFSATHNMADSDYDALANIGFTDAKVGNAVFDLGYGSDIKADDKFSGFGIPTDGYGVFNLTINGVTKEIKVAKPKDDADPAEAINNAIKTAFGADMANKVQMELKDGTMSLNVKDTNLAVHISKGEPADSKTVDIYGALGFSGESNNLNTEAAGGAKFSDFISGKNLVDGELTINGEKITYTKDTTLREFMNKINDALGSNSAATVVNGKLTISSPNADIEITDTQNMLSSMFGITGTVDKYETDENGNVLYEDGKPKVELDGDGKPVQISGFRTTGEDYTTSDGKSTRKEGLNAEIIMDGRVISSKSNVFSIDGVDVEVNAVSGKDDAPIKVGVKSDPEDVITRIKDWITDYNAMIATLTAAISEDKNSSYAPLTDEQKAEMTADQIKVWETEAKKGLLRNDSTLRGILSDLRNTLYEKVSAAGISLYDIGITTKSYNSSGASDAGQIEISDESKLRAMLESNPDKVRMLFTDANEGVATKMNSIIDKAARDSSVDRGSLITLAGTERSTGNNTSTLGKKIDAIDKYVTALKARLESEYNRYWKQFSVLETSIQKLNMQSSWLAQS